MGSKADIFRAIAQTRRSSRRFQPGRSIPKPVMRDILESTIRSPSSFNLQPTQIVMVQSQEVKDQLSEKAMLGTGNQYRTEDASAVAVFLSDLQAGKRMKRIMELEKGHRHPNYLASLPVQASFLIGEGHAATMIKNMSTGLLGKLNNDPMPVVEPVQAWSYKNTSLVAQSFVYAASSYDLATSIMEGFDSKRVAELLRIPDDRYAIPLIVAAGYEYESPEDFMPTPRLKLEEIVFEDTFASPIDLVDDSSSSDGEAA